MKKSNYSAFYLLVLVLFGISCSNVKFQEPAPLSGKTLQAFPEKWIGDYIDEEGKRLVVAKDHFVYTELGDSEAHFLGDTIVLKKWKGNYYLNLKGEDYWDALQVESKEGNLVLLEIDLEEERIPELEAITPILKEKKGKNLEEDYVLINPDKSAFDRLVKGTYFSKSYTFEPQK